MAITIEETNRRWDVVASTPACTACAHLDSPAGCDACQGTGLQKPSVPVLTCLVHGIVYTRLVPPRCALCNKEPVWIAALFVPDVIDRKKFITPVQRRRDDLRRRHAAKRAKRKAAKT